MIESVSAVTLATHNMPRAVAFYRMLGFEILYGGDDAAFKSLRAGTSFPHNPRSESGLSGDASSSTIPTPTASMRA